MDTNPDTPFLEMLQLIGLKLKKQADESIKELGLNSQQGKLIAFIHEHQEQGLIQKDLSERFHVRGASITSMLQGLEKKGYIERKIPAHNERQKNIYVLPKGLALINDFELSFQRVEEKIVQNLNEDDRQVLQQLLTKINQNL
ncbi:MarR family transcriptional regulator [Paenibacillus sp. HWE-109]|uniref:MarR family winged helix-turn-helix transcriptional regulator n=1 Tax=Paenibacillus sp. HWE-109 TaxID=1306526 RepID=UPI001EDEA0B6|nr:MarR family transcriptional regulator [Paenibacillus sp. HWE-109]UKS29610.1 MarR family transcriptional regulator [Paenibacillus sp. HWE-109]